MREPFVLDRLEMEGKTSLWENEGGSVLSARWKPLTGTVNQIEWAEQIRIQVNAEFDRVAGVLEAYAIKQPSQEAENTRLMIGILEEKRDQVLSNPKAGYFIHDWQELRDQVRKLIMKDERYAAIKAGKRSVDTMASSPMR